jgi:signal transduction histidine kinase
MQLENEKCELERIAKALRSISKEICHRGVAEALLAAALGYSGAVRGAVMLSKGGKLLEQADASFLPERESVIVSHPPASKFQLPVELSERVFRRQETVVRYDGSELSAFIEPAASAGQDISLLCLPLIHQEETIGVLYLESRRWQRAFESKCVSVVSMLASQAAVSFELAQVFEALRETNIWMVKSQEIGRVGVYWWNTRTLLSRVSQELHRIFDVDLDINPVPFEVFKDRVHPDDFPALERAIAKAVSTRSPFNHEYRVVHKDGTILQVVAMGQVDVGPSGDVELQGTISDVTKQKASEQAVTDARAELARAAGLASLGELGGSIIHEVNQPLTGITMSAEACLLWLDRDPADLNEARKSAMRVIDQARRASEVVDGLKSLVRNAGLHFTGVQIERAGVTLKTEFDRSMPEIEADRVQIQQVVLNLVRNAIDAMATVNERPRVLSCSSKMTDSHISVTIADTGVGIDPASKERLFEALYTTKSEGLGLGLSICRKIVTAHGGRLQAEKNATHGTTFTFTLPLRQSNSYSNPRVPGAISTPDPSVFFGEETFGALDGLLTKSRS